MARAWRHIERLGRGMRMLLSFLLVFSLSFGMQAAVVARAMAASDYYVANLFIYMEDELGNLDVDNPIADGLDQEHRGSATIETHGGSIAFGAGVQWNDDSIEVPADGRITWSLEDPNGIATLTPGGLLQANGDGEGTVTVVATVNDEYLYEYDDGTKDSLVARVDVQIMAQSGPFVTKISICDENGKVIKPAYSFNDDDLLGTAMVELGAYVTVRDPDTNEDTEYHVTAGNGLATQTGGALPDIEWSVNDELYGSITVDGIYKPLTSGQNTVYAVSTAGVNGERVSSQITVSMPGTSSDYHPQDQLTVKVYYEKDRDTTVKEMTFDVPYLESLGTWTVTYTAKGGGGANGFITYTGRGPYLAAILREMGLDLTGIKELRFGTADNYQDAVSWDWIVDTDRYYFPNLDVNSEAGKVQVAPMIAIESAKSLPDTPTAPNYDLTDDRRFLLLFGSKTGSQQTNTSHYQVYNIHTIYVVLEGAPPIEGGGNDDGNGNGDDQPQPEQPQGETTPQQGGNGGNAGAASNGGAGANGAAVTGVAKNGQSAGSGSKAQASSSNAADSASSTSTGSGLTMGDLTVVGDGGKWSALQAINRHKSDVSTLLLDNPLAPFVGPMCAGCFGAGGIEVLVGYRRQRRTPEVDFEEES